MLIQASSPHVVDVLLLGNFKLVVLIVHFFEVKELLCFFLEILTGSQSAIEAHEDHPFIII